MTNSTCTQFSQVTFDNLGFLQKTFYKIHVCHGGGVKISGRKENKTGKVNPTKKKGIVSNKTASLLKQNRTQQLLEDQLLQLLIESESNRTNQNNTKKGFGYTWKEIVEKQASKNKNNSKVAVQIINKSLLQKQKEDLQKLEESLPNEIKNADKKDKKEVVSGPLKAPKGAQGKYEAKNKKIDELVDPVRLRQLEDQDRALEESVNGWKTEEIGGDAGCLIRCESIRVFESCLWHKN